MEESLTSEEQHVVERVDLSICTSINHGYAKPIYYHCPQDNKEYIIISSEYDDQFIFFYDIIDDSYIKKYKYPSGFQPRFHVIVLDETENKLYLIGGHHHIFAVLDLKNGEWNIKCNGKTEEIEKYNIAFFCTSYPYVVNNKIHVYHEGKYMTYTANEDKFVSVSDIDEDTNNYQKIEDSKLVLITAPKRKFLLIGGETQWEPITDIWCYDGLETDGKWKLLEAKLQTICQYYEYIALVGFGSILFVFVDDMESIYCLDLLITNKWYLSDKKMEDFEGFTFAVKTPKNDVHLMKFRGSAGDTYHNKFSLYDVIPNELANLYQNYYNDLVMGYIKSNIEKQYKLIIPNALKHLIADFFSYFV